MRILVGAASIAVVAFVAVWFWDRHYDPSAVADRERAAECEMYRQESTAGLDGSAKQLNDHLIEERCVN